MFVYILSKNQFGVKLINDNEYYYNIFLDMCGSKVMINMNTVIKISCYRINKSDASNVHCVCGILLTEASQKKGSIRRVLNITMANKKASFKNDVVVIRKAMSDTITSRYGALRDALESLMESFAAHLLEDELIDKDVAEKQIYHHIMGQFLSGMDTKDSIPDLEEHCQIFADVLKELGEATNKIASELNNEWNAIIKQQPLVSAHKLNVHILLSHLLYYFATKK